MSRNMLARFSGIDLAPKDNSATQGYGKSDPYLIIRLDNDKGEEIVNQKNNYIADDLNPTFEDLTLKVPSEDQTLWIQVMDYDHMARDDIIGNITVKMSELKTGTVLQLNDYKERPDTEKAKLKAGFPGQLKVEFLEEESSEEQLFTLEQLDKWTPFLLTKLVPPLLTVEILTDSHMLPPTLKGEQPLQVIDVGEMKFENLKKDPSA
eukprot:CAMPEP_0181341836 /NCGR_PEP_ID=MMETSP1101-20121128/30657_1 /TAXON_ID=46948 /ORGANISM="Rhodomonas abbreviata, Strain Caron Lab Isolate" /LENGTH=206 /DNA_ID=CAMNT_0023453209 /DNA_START=109 /DNA_END=725 /DNA_ORIENTATION=+